VSEDFIAVSLSPESPDRYRRLAQIVRLAHDIERLASLRGALIVLLTILGAPLLLLARTEDPGSRHALTALALLWVGCAATLARVVWAERRSRRQAARLASR
jgi:hypothetical protein